MTDDIEIVEGEVPDAKDEGDAESPQNDPVPDEPAIEGDATSASEA